MKANLDPLLVLIDGLEGNQRQVTAAFCATAIAKLFSVIEGLGILERSQHMVITSRKEPVVVDEDNPFVI